MMGLTLMLLLAVVQDAGQGAGQDRTQDRTQNRVVTPIALPDPMLAEQRGGFTLPNGVDVSLSVQTTTAVNGALVLRTVFTADRGAPTVAIYAPRPGQTIAGDLRPAGTGTAMSSPTVTYDARSGIQVTPGIATVAVGGGMGPMTAVPDGLARVDAGAVTDNGTVAQTANGLARSVTLQGSDLSVTHLVGSALGSAIANSGSNRTIDTQTSVAIDLHGAGPDVVGSSMLRAQGVAEGALRGRI